MHRPITEPSSTLSELQTSMQQSLAGQLQVQDGINRSNAAATRLELASKQADASAVELAGSVKQISEAVGQVKKNTSFWSAFLMGLGVGFLTGIPGNIGTSYWYERHLSVAAEAAKNHPNDGTPPAPLPNLIEPWPPAPAEGRDIMTWFRQNDIYIFTPVPTPATPATPPARDARYPLPDRRRHLRHQR